VTTSITNTIPYDGSQFLADPVDQVDALNDALDSGSAAVLAIALRDIAKARGMTDVAKKVGITRAGLYKALSGEGDPKLSTFVALLAVLDIKLVAKAATTKKAASSDEVAERMIDRAGRNHHMITVVGRMPTGKATEVKHLSGKTKRTSAKGSSARAA
jgi:probable addiction module antidote protein